MFYTFFRSFYEDKHSLHLDASRCMEIFLCFWKMIESQRKKLNNPNSLRIVISGMTFCEYGNVNKNFWSAYGNMCCGATGVYDNNVAKCCNGEKLVPKSSFCGSVRYDQCTHLCCNEYLHPKIEGITSCCGKSENAYLLQ